MGTGCPQERKIEEFRKAAVNLTKISLLRLKVPECSCLRGCAPIEFPSRTAELARSASFADNAKNLGSIDDLESG